jgi:hypothetical protein
MKDPVDHIARAVLPWREAERGLTECGLAAASYPTIDREAYFQRLTDFGKTRAAMLTCVTCSDVVRHHAPWHVDPVSAIEREVTHYFGRYSEDRPRPPNPKYEPFRRELRAIAALIAAHREEFDAYLVGLGTVSELDEARRKKQAAGKKARADLRNPL